ncbi:MAG TPA: DUF4157 domain-containing protein [Chitinophagaceae bacterium]|nr:DUF4157 domain-containing protein [Chitinophagaceae bacterium]HNF70842.1 DUF4157 domain-containing protein [Chitinophagaceae bacterium]
MESKVTPVRIVTSSFPARIAAWKLGRKKVAMVWNGAIHLHGCSREEFLSNERWLKHELCHIQQRKEKGAFWFECHYLWLSLRYGYEQNPYEVEARRAELADEAPGAFQWV